PAAIQGQRPVCGAVGEAGQIKGPDDFLTRIPGEDYRHGLRHIFSMLAGLEGPTIIWGTTGCSLRVAVPDRRPLSVGWIFPPDIPRRMRFTDLTLGWVQGRQGDRRH